MKRRIISLLVAIVIIAIFTAVYINFNKKNTEDDLKLVKVNEVTRSVFYAPQYVAISNGFFEKQGLKVELTTGQGADKVMTAVLANQCDIGFAGPEASIYVYNEGKAAGELPYTAYFAKKSYIETNEDTIQKFTNAIYEGQIWVKDHTAKEIAREHTRIFPRHRFGFIRRSCTKL